MAQLRCSSFSATHFHTANSNRHLSPPPIQSPKFPHNKISSSSSTSTSTFSLQTNLSTPNSLPRLPVLCAGGNGTSGIGGGAAGGGGGGGGGGFDGSSSFDTFGPIGAFLAGWRSRVAADPQFPFKVLMEEVVGLSSCVLGDMASRPNFGLNELDFVFSTLVVGSILNFTLMYLLAPTMSTGTAACLPSIFANCPASHMFEPGPYGVLHRFGTFVYKGTIFAAVGFAAGLVGTALSNGLIKMRKKMDPTFESPNKPPPTILNALTWALHMGISSNFRYQTLNGVEYLLAKGLPPVVFKSSVVVLRCMNNVLGGMSFVILARLTGSQSEAKAVTVTVTVTAAEEGSDTEKVKLVDETEDLGSNETASK